MSTTWKKPTVVLVPGAWHTPSAFEPVLPLLHGAGYPTATVALPSVGVSPGLLDFTDDVAAIRTLVEGLVDDLGREVLVVSHSYGAIPATEAVGSRELHHLGARARKARNQSGGVVGLVYIAAVLPMKGQSLGDSTGPVDSAEAEVLPVAEYDYRENGTSIVINPIEAFYGDVKPIEAKFFTRLLKTHSSKTFQSPLTNEAYRDTPSAYLFCTHDMALPIMKQQRMARDAGITTTQTLSTSHSPFLSKPGAVVDFIRRVAGEELLSSSDTS